VRYQAVVETESLVAHSWSLIPSSFIDVFNDLLKGLLVWVNRIVNQKAVGVVRK
jgi:hypothetical protein